jgi:hypothetical protein
MSNFSNIRDFYNQPNGVLTADYSESDLITAVDETQHYNIRSFHNDNPTVPWTMNDMRYWDVDHFSSFVMDDFSRRRSIAGRTFRHHTMTEIDAFLQSDMDALTMEQLDYAIVASGDEEWPISNPSVTFGRDASLRYSNSLSVNITMGATTVSSAYNDDLWTNFQDQDYYIEFLIRGFPAQTDPAWLDLNNSFIDFTSDNGVFASPTSNFVPFSASLNDLSAGGDVVFRINRNTLDKVNLSALTNIRFRLFADGVGTFTFKVQNFRLIPANDRERPLSIDTKRQIYRRTVPRTGGAEPTYAFSPIFFRDARPQNTTFAARLNSGHNPVGNDNILRVYLRYEDINDHVRIELTSRNTQSRLRIYERTSGVDTEIFSTPTNTNALTEMNDYWLEIVANGETINASIYNLDGVFKTTLVYTTGDQTVDRDERGYVGYSLEPYYYDFYLDDVGSSVADYAHFESTPFSSMTPVIGATILPATSLPINLIADDELVALGDASFVYDSTSSEYTITRDGTQWIGGLATATEINASDADQLFIEGELFTSSLNGLYRVTLVDANTSVAWIADLPDLSAQQWNSFRIPIMMENIPPQGFFVNIHQAGFYSGEFKIRNLALNYDSIEWFASPDSGTTWQPFLDATGNIYTGLRFDTPGTALKVRGIARSDEAWIQSYELIPHYKFPGHS